MILSSTPSFFNTPLPEGFKPAALVVDTNHRLVSRMLPAIQDWVRHHEVRLVTFFVSNPLHSFVLKLWDEDYVILPWTPHEVQLVNGNGFHGATDLDDPFRRSIRPLANLTHPEFTYEIMPVRDAEIEGLLQQAAAIITKPGDPTLNDPIAQSANQSFKALLQKMQRLAVPLELHVKHMGSSYGGRSIPKHAAMLREYGERVRQANYLVTEKCVAFADIVARFLTATEQKAPAKARALLDQVLQTTHKVCIADSTFNDCDAIREFIATAAGAKPITTARLDDLDFTPFADELWLTGVPTIYQAHNLRSGIAPRVRVFCYTVEENWMPEIVDLAHAASGLREHDADRIRGYQKLFGRMFPIPADRGPSIGPRIVKGGTTVARRRQAPAYKLVQELQKSMSWDSLDHESPMAVPTAAPRPTSGDELVDAVTLQLDQSMSVSFAPDDLLGHLTLGSDEATPTQVRDLKVGERVLLSLADFRKPIIEALYERLKTIPKISVLAHYARRWSERLKDYKTANAVTYQELFRRFAEIHVDMTRTSLVHPMTLRFWAESMVIGPMDPADLMRALRLIGDQQLIDDYGKTLTAVKRLRGLHSRIIRHIMQQATEGSWSEGIVIDEDFDVYFDDFASLFKEFKITGTKPGKVSKYQLGQRQ